jgi:Tfp pilus assembly protein PilO
MNLKSPGATKLIGAVAMLLVAALGWLLLLGPETAALSDVQSQTTSVSEQNDVLRLQLVELQTQEKELEQIREDAAALAVKFPATADQPGLFQAVTAAVTDAGIPTEGLTALTPTPPAVGAVDAATGVELTDQPAAPELARQTVTVAVVGTYDETRLLLGNLEQMPRAYLVTSLTVTASSTDETGVATGEFTTTILGEMYVMPLADKHADAAVPETD